MFNSRAYIGKMSKYSTSCRPSLSLAFAHGAPALRQFGDVVSGFGEFTRRAHQQSQDHG